MSRRGEVRGQPLVALLAVLGGWIVGRVVTWEPPTLIRTAAASEMARPVNFAPKRGAFVFDANEGPQSLPGSGAAGPAAAVLPDRAGWMPAGYAQEPFALGPAAAGFAPRRSAVAVWDPPFGKEPGAFAWGASIHDPGLGEYPQLPRLSALAAQPSPPVVVGAGGSPAQADQAGRKSQKRWSGDSWVLLRRGGSGALVSGALPPTYGASQAGVVLRYRIDPRDQHRTAAYVRTTSALGQTRETSAALGLSARPLPSLPIVAAVEARVTDQAGARRFQPAIMAVTELPPFELPFETRAEIYAQAGYVGGQFATPFADGQLRLDRSLLRSGAIEARLGAGLWGGAQEGAGRLDFGPSATMSMPLGPRTFGRFALDWRFRALGNAEPQSGPALTLSAGF